MRRCFLLFSKTIVKKFAVKIIILTVFLLSFLDSFGLRIGTWNLRNYCILNRRFQTNRGFRFEKNYPKPEDEKKSMYETIKMANLDVLVVQEIGNESFLRELKKDLEAACDEYFPFAIAMISADKTRGLGMLSKVPFEKIYKHNQLRFKYFGQNISVRRGLFEIVFKKDEISKFDTKKMMNNFENSKQESSQLKFKSAKDLLYSIKDIFYNIQSVFSKNVLEITNTRLAKTEISSSDFLHLFVIHLKSKGNSKFTEDREFNNLRFSEAYSIKNFLSKRFREGVTSFLLLGDFNDSINTNVLNCFKRNFPAEILKAEDSKGEFWSYFYEKHLSYFCYDYIISSKELIRSIKDRNAHIFDVPKHLRNASDHRLLYVDLEIKNNDENISNIKTSEQTFEIKNNVSQLI